MIVVNVFMARGLKHRYIPLDEGQGCMGRRCQKYGPLILTLVASPLIMADLMRHVLGDVGAWPWCGDPSVQGGVFPRINESWSDACFWSSTEYRCNIPCCVPGNNTVQGANDYDLNYLLRTNATDGTNVQLPFSEFCGMDADGNVVPIEGATHTNPNCTCAMGACDPDKAPADQMAVLAVGDASLRLLAPLEPGQQQDTNYPQGFANDPQRADTFAPYWPAYPQLDAETLAYVKSEAVKGNPDVAPEDIPDCNCLNCVPADQENIHHLSFIGVLFTIIFTYTGFIMLAVGTLWNANIIKKCGEIKQQWRQLRRQREAIAGRKKRRVVSGFSSTDDKVAPLLGGSRKE